MVGSKNTKVIMREYNLTIVAKGQLYDITLKAQDYFDALYQGREAGRRLGVNPSSVKVVRVLRPDHEVLM